jgi:hypothetical protein
MENGQNGYTNPRMDRLENLMEVLIADHVKFADEHNKLLTSQILLTDAQRITDEQIKASQERQKLTDEQMKATDERISILVSMMDGFIRNSNRPTQ